jgi:hypothetical protein
MADFETQVISEEQIVSDAVMSTEAFVSQFKRSLSLVRACLVNYIQEQQAIRLDIKKLSDTLGFLVSSFKTEASAMYPDLIVKDLDSILPTLSGSHPLSILWEQYRVKIDQAEQSLLVAESAYVAKTTEVAKALQDEDKVLTDYANFANTSPIAVPSVDQLRTLVENEEVIPYVEEGSTNAYLPAIETVSPEAASIVMLQAAENEDQYLYYQEPSLQSDGEYTGNGEFYAAIDESARVATEGNMVMAQPSTMKPLGIAATILALAYVFLGGKE